MSDDEITMDNCALGDASDVGLLPTDGFDVEIFQDAVDDASLTEYLVAAQVALPDDTLEQRHYAVYEPTPERARTTVVKTWGARGFTPTERPTVARVTEDSHRRGTRVITGP